MLFGRCQRSDLFVQGIREKMLGEGDPSACFEIPSKGTSPGALIDTAKKAVQVHPSPLLPHCLLLPVSVLVATVQLVVFASVFAVKC